MAALGGNALDPFLSVFETIAGADTRPLKQNAQFVGDPHFMGPSTHRPCALLAVDRWSSLCTGLLGLPSNHRGSHLASSSQGNPASTQEKRRRLPSRRIAFFAWRMP